MKYRHIFHLFGVVIFLAFIGYYLFFLHTTYLPNYRRSIDISKLKTSEIPIINAGTTFFKAPLYGALHITPDLTQSCPKQCFFIEDFIENPKTKIDITLLHARNLQDTGIESIKYASNAGLLGTKIIFSMECPLYTPIDHFNHDLILTYQSNQYGLTRPYNGFEEITNTTSLADIWTHDQVTSAVKAKTKGLLLLVSNCDTYSSREYLTEALSKIIPITIYGQCSKIPCDDSCEIKAIKDHYFYLAFENSVCNEYITEKFWRLKDLIVPIVLSRGVIGNIAPADSFIAVDDFKSLQALADYLNFLMNNHDEYLKYFSWTKQFKKIPPKLTIECSLCNLAWELRSNSTAATAYLPTYDQWVSQSNCKLNYALSLMTAKELEMTSYFPLYKKLIFLIIPMVFFIFALIYAYQLSKTLVTKIFSYILYFRNNKG